MKKKNIIIIVSIILFVILIGIGIFIYYVNNEKRKLKDVEEMINRNITTHTLELPKIVDRAKQPYLYDFINSTIGVNGKVSDDTFYAFCITETNDIFYEKLEHAEDYVLPTKYIYIEELTDSARNKLMSFDKIKEENYEFIFLTNKDLYDDKTESWGMLGDTEISKFKTEIILPTDIEFLRRWYPGQYESPFWDNFVPQQEYTISPNKEGRRDIVIKCIGEDIFEYNGNQYTLTELDNVMEDYDIIDFLEEKFGREIKGLRK